MGTLTVGRYTTAGAASDTHGYTAGGYGPGAVNTIDKFPFATENNATDVGDLTQARFLASGTNSGENGYASGGFAPSAPGRVNIIDKYPFSTDTNASDVGDLSTTNRDKMAGNSSKTHGYGSSGESTPSPAPTVPEATIDKFPFAVDANATDVGDVATNRVRSHGTQV